MAEDRANRAAEVSAERRRRNDLSGAPRLKLAIPDHIRDKLAAEGRTPRWVNDTGSRIADLTIRDDYDPVEGVDPAKWTSSTASPSMPSSSPNRTTSSPRIERKRKCSGKPSKPE
jgi:hypothetical protein